MAILVCSARARARSEHTCLLLFSGNVSLTLLQQALDRVLLLQLWSHGHVSLVGGTRANVYLRKLDCKIFADCPSAKIGSSKMSSYAVFHVLTTPYLTMQLQRATARNWRTGKFEPANYRISKRYNPGNYKFNYPRAIPSIIKGL